MRIDKFLKISRVLKRRSVANEACRGSKVSVNGKPIKPSYEVKIGDVVAISFGNGKLTFKVTMIKETVKKEEAALMYELVPNETT